LRLLKLIYGGSDVPVTTTPRFPPGVEGGYRIPAIVLARDRELTYDASPKFWTVLCKERLLIYPYVPRPTTVERVWVFKPTQELSRVGELMYREDPRPTTVLCMFDMKDREPFKNGVMELVRSAVLIY
jgi:hypothetical protein